MASEFENGEVASPVAENETVQSGISSTANKEIKKKKLPDNTHGLRFESKLLSLFCVRGLGSGYKFELSKEKEEEGGKLEDLIFRYQVPDETPVGKHWRYRYLQAKHKENEKEKITADHLLDYNRKGDFSLPKYFHSFYKIRARGDDIHDCIICTNIGFDVNSLEKGGVELVSINDQSEDILEFGALEDRTTARYKLKINNDDWHRRLKEEWSPVQLLAEELKDCATKSKTTDIRAGMLNSYHVALVDEHVIDCTKKKFHQDFVSDAGSLSGGAKELRQTLCELCENDEWKNWKFILNNPFGKGQSAVKNSLPRKITEEDVDDFFDKLIFVVDMPHENKFEEILETRDMSKYYQREKCKAQTIRILHEVSKEFSNQEQKFWLKAEIAKNILLADVTKMSLEYQSRLEKEIKFNISAIKKMVNQLKQLLTDCDGRGKVERIATPSPKHTAVKVISAVQILMRELNQEKNYLVASSSRLQNEAKMEMWRNILKLQKGLRHFFVIVCDDESPVSSYENLITDNQADDNNFIIIISQTDKSSVGLEDEIKYTDLNEDCQEAILSKTVSFQGENLTVGNLIGYKPEEIIDFTSIKELLFEEKEIKITSFNTATFEQSLYVKRRLRLPFVSQWELGGECKISSYGHIEWLVEKEKRKEVWEKIKSRIQASSKGVIVDDLAHLKKNGNEKSVVIISGVAGTGKSTLLCHYYEVIKRAKPDHWIIRMNLVDYEDILKLDNITDFNVADLFINRLRVVDEKSSYSRSLLRNRLKTGDRIIFMFDGFDEVNKLCQDKAIELMKVITKNKSTQLYVTTRPHMLDKLQFQLSQLSCNLENFTENDQIDYLASYWEKELNLSGDKNESLQKFAQSLVERVSETLKDEEKSFVGIPLQCKILAECFQSNAGELIKSNYATNNEESRSSEDGISNSLVDQKFDLISLFNRLMETKRKVFREEKANATNTNQIMVDAINRLIQDVEDHLTKIAIKTIVTDQQLLNVLLPSQTSYRSDQDITKWENTIAQNGLKFGLTFKSGDESKVQFLHRTYAEYLFARYLYQGFLLDEKRHNKLLDNESIRMLILKKILATWEYHGVQVFFNSMLKELVEGNKKWRNRIDNRDLPERIKKLTENFYDRFLCQELPPQETVTRGSGGYSFTPIAYQPNQRFDSENALHFSLWTGNTTTFTFLCDCLDATFNKKQIVNVMMKSFIQGSYFSFAFFRKTNSSLFKRFINCLDSEADKVMSTLTTFSCNLPPSDLEYSQWNGEEQKKTVGHLLQFMTNQRDAFEEYFEPCRGITIVHMLTFLIFNENYDSHLEIFLGLLSRSRAYADDFQFESLLKKAFCSKVHFIGGRIEKVLITLQELNRHNLLIQLYGIVLAIEPESFQNIYQPPPIEGNAVGKDVESMDLNRLTERDSYRMTRLHRAAFHGNTKEVEEMLERIRQNVTDSEHKKVAYKITNEVMTRDEFGFTPFYVAAVRAVKKELGQNKLLQILRLPKSRYSSSFVSACYKTKKLFYSMAIVVMRDDNDTGDTDFKSDFYKLVLEAGLTTEIDQFIAADNHQGKLSFKDFNDYANEYKLFVF
ncbi:hypothetical protein DAPPUDRAFT_97425 [Daphnia pulex]|uniref:NACHT domain-containing protein n=1 Tax=Daphnia pulex TaxID=6669 RepID=E9G006_DAPPU|nr:hypothetical protein DAPPUDRAFT_97425 [Daphnia pulex]|eukprot:EFX87170.1 hypothetical protein DAPPUDRAFT_97425 [Daphnia pulex]